jgi:TPR repeat protein
LYAYREGVGQSLISLGQKMSATRETSSQVAKVPDPPKPPVETQQPPAPTNSANEQDHPSQPDGVLTDSRYRPEDIPASTKPESTFRDARPRSAPADTVVHDSGSNDPVEQARALWSAVAQGNTSAEVTLAKLYLIGGGVTKSCDQARVLFKAAAKKGNGEALNKLSQIQRQGCP